LSTQARRIFEAMDALVAGDAAFFRVAGSHIGVHEAAHRGHAAVLGRFRPGELRIERRVGFQVEVAHEDRRLRHGRRRQALRPIRALACSAPGAAFGRRIAVDRDQALHLRFAVAVA